MTEEFKEADLETQPELVVKQEVDLLFKVASKKSKLEYIYHWNRLLVASSRIQKKEIPK